MASQDDSSQSSKEDSECPMCLEELDLTDLNFKPCSCGYQVFISLFSLFHFLK